MSRGIIALDLDGTIVHRGLTVYGRDLEALHRAVQAGFVPVVATGRRAHTARRFAIDLGLRQSPVITCDGALVLGPAGDALFRAPVPESAVRRTAEICERMGVSCAFSAADTYYLQYGTHRVHFIRWMWRRWAPRSLGRLRRALWDFGARRILKRRFEALEAVYKIDIFGPGAAEARSWLLPELRGVQETMPRGALEVVAAGVDKASGIEQLIGPMGLSWNDVMAIGNDWNDLRMIERAGFGVAMGDAPGPVREAADYVTRTVSEGGLAEAVGMFLSRHV